ncbi:tRNA (adenosine(37)-N6)-threonylcarbamoyltransferase complex dimerization subunit type 1 TsaB [Candidatus Gillettellia adelgis]
MSTKILAIDTSTESCSVSIYNNGEILVLSELNPRQHTQRILPIVQQILSDSGLLLNQLDALAFSCGPGNFTGVRVGMGVTQGLALGADLPMLGISTLKTMAQGAWRVSHAERVLAAIEARKNKVYWGQFERQQQGHWNKKNGEIMLSYTQVLEYSDSLKGNWAYVGTAWQQSLSLVRSSTLNLYNGGILLPSAEDMLPLALQDWQLGLAIAVENAKLIYLHNEVTWKKLPGRT